MRLRQILRNLLSNTRRYEGPEIRVHGHVEEHTYVVEVIDNGDGLPKHVTDRLFERFVHQDRQTTTQGSVGLGLSIVHALVQGMAGSISYARLDGESYFRVRLPLTVGPAEIDAEPVVAAGKQLAIGANDLAAHRVEDR